MFARVPPTKQHYQDLKIDQSLKFVTAPDVSGYSAIIRHVEFGGGGGCCVVTVLTDAANAVPLRVPRAILSSSPGPEIRQA
jgi:hypothetical protein